MHLKRNITYNIQAMHTHTHTYTHIHTHARTLTHYIDGLEVSRSPHNVDVEDQWRRGTHAKQEHQCQEHAYRLHVLILRTLPSVSTSPWWW